MSTDELWTDASWPEGGGEPDPVPENETVFDTGFAGNEYQMPTATTNPQRPRTVAAKYQANEKAVYVVMRAYYTKDGTLKTPVVKYFPMTALDWRNFKSAYSKGRFILHNWDPVKEWEEVSGTGGLDALLVSYIAIAEARQKAQDGFQVGQNPNSPDSRKLRKAVAEGRRVSDVRLRSDRLGGTGRARKQSAELEEARRRYYGSTGRTPPP